MFNENVIVKANELTMGTEDINGMKPVIMTPVYGTIPNRAMTISGTIAQNEGIEVGKVYLVNIRQTETNEYGFQYRHGNLGEITALDLAKSAKDFKEAFGSPNVLDVREQSEKAGQLFADGNYKEAKALVNEARKEEVVEEEPSL